MTTTKLVLLIIAHNGYHPIEYGHTREELEKAGFTVKVASNIPGIAQASPSNSPDASHYKTVLVDSTIDQIDPTDYAGIFLIGGPGAINDLDTPATYKVIQNFAKTGRPFGAICISPRILAQSGTIKGKNATGWNEDQKLQTIFKNAGVLYQQQPVVVDKTLITANGPKAARDFGRAIVQLLT